MKKLLSVLKDSPDFSSVLTTLKGESKAQLVYGLSGSQRRFVQAAVIDKGQRSCLLVTEDEQEAEKAVEELKFFLPDENISLFPAYEMPSPDLLPQSRDVLSKRLAVLQQIESHRQVIVVTPIKALLTELAPPQLFRQGIIHIQTGEPCDREAFIGLLVDIGYEHVHLVESRGQFSVRGGIVDLFDDGDNKPSRIEFFGDEIDSIRIFDPLTQRSEDSVVSVTIFPAKEAILNEKIRSRAVERIQEELSQQLTRVKKKTMKEELRLRAKRVMDMLEEKQDEKEIEVYLPYFYEQKTLLVDYFPDQTLIMLDDPVRLAESAGEYETLHQDIFTSALESGKALPKQKELVVSYETFLTKLKGHHRIVWMSLLRQIPMISPDHIVSFSARPVYPFQGNTQTAKSELESYIGNRYRVVMLVKNKKKADLIKDIFFEDQKRHVQISDGFNDVPEYGQALITLGTLASGFEFPSLKLVVFTEEETSLSKKRKRKKQSEKAFTPVQWKDLQVRDYVVHIHHGIGQYQGVKTLEIEDSKKDYLEIRYHGADKLFVPVDQMDLVQKYIGPDGYSPKLSRLGGADWNRVKQDVQEAVEEMAEHLLNLYALREASEGYSFSQDTAWQREFEDEFMFAETEDQLTAAAEIKKSMEKEKPMDRILCGDVGYGKTEVAVRAAFKAVMDAKQVGVLVPTTVLAQQHYNTFQSRFSNYPVNIAMLSRFVPQKKQKEIIEKVEQGKIDIVIGTHRLLQSDIRFSDLGLLVVDEEQRFGVRHKEKIKEIRKNIDVLTMTATPIPRTLHMALSGIRDMSTIDAPPEDRLPVHTYVLEHDRTIVKNAIEREIKRGGQVYYIHNTVRSIQKTAKDLQKLVPEASIAMAHGQMREELLEKTMIGFIEGEYDILICTTIVETGLDIPNVNTIIVDNADHFGLSQLYQLRGRVGRSTRQGYAYFVFHKDKVLTEIAEKRLEAIREFTEFGAGFKIAMRDLELRGAGNLLGAQQHGHVSAVGFEMYCRLLEEAVKRAKGEEKADETPEPEIDIAIDAYLPEQYIKDSQQKIETYKKIASCRFEEEIRDIIDEMVDRFGDIPKPALQLIEIVRLRILAREAKVTSVIQKGDCITLNLADISCYHHERASLFMQENRKHITVASTDPLKISLVKMSRFNQAERLSLLKNMLHELGKCVQN